MNNIKKKLEELEDETMRVEEEAYVWTKTNSSRIKDLQDRLSALADYLGVGFVEVMPTNNPIEVRPKEEKETK